jgi:hypothetical protein
MDRNHKCEQESPQCSNKPEYPDRKFQGLANFVIVKPFQALGDELGRREEEDERGKRIGKNLQEIPRGFRYLAQHQIYLNVSSLKLSGGKPKEYRYQHEIFLNLDSTRNRARKHKPDDDINKNGDGHDAKRSTGNIIEETACGVDKFLQIAGYRTGIPCCHDDLRLLISCVKS